MIKKIGIALLIIIVGFAILLWIISEPKPEGTTGPEAEELAQKMYTAMNGPAFENLPAVSWTFKGVHRYAWDKENKKVAVSWKDTSVELDLNSLVGKVYVNGKEKNNNGEVQKAISYFYNDSFWLAAPYKVFDTGVQRSTVNTPEGKALLVTYTEGGATPGDTYLWHLDENYFPRKVEMWVKIIPVGGMEFTWEDWKQFDGDVWFAQDHKGLLNIEIDDIKTASSIRLLQNK